MPRLIAYPLLLAAGVVSLPVAAAFLDGPSTENWVLPIQLAGMAALGALVGWGTPAIARSGASTSRRIVIGALLGVGAALVGVALFFLLLNGISGA